MSAVDMCFTGNFALSMMLEPALLAPVLRQPPLQAPGALNIAPSELAQGRRRLQQEGLTVRAYRFEDDRSCTAERFAAYASALRVSFEATVLPSSAANPAPAPFFTEVIGCPHSGVTAHLIDRDREPTIAARDGFIAFLTLRLHARAAR